LAEISGTDQKPMKKMPLGKTFLFIFALAAAICLPRVAISGEGDYSFKVHNTTEETITELLCSEDGEKYGKFDIGDGIKPGESMKLVWDKSTNSQSCHQYFKAVFEDGKESNPKKFDFCEEGLELAF
jgi:hypothetical protein